MVLPHLFAKYGLHAFFLLLVVLMLLISPLYKQLSSVIPSVSPTGAGSEGTASGSFSIWKIIGVISVLAFFTSISSVWTFLTSIGTNSQLTENAINGYLSMATLFGILGCFLAILIGHTAKRLLVLPIGFILFFISIALLFGQISDLEFMGSVFLFKFAWMFTFPFILGSLASIDLNGSIMKFVSFVIGMGMAIGPAIAGYIVEGSVGFSNLLAFTFVLFVFSMLLLLLINFKAKSETGDLMLKPAL